MKEYRFQEQLPRHPFKERDNNVDKFNLLSPVHLTVIGITLLEQDYPTKVQVLIEQLQRQSGHQDWD
ncbi:hypothetical protein CW304_29290 [Bacillus sp. UFRGS-B20]|nr:hypothetical protein CW304_29290 [Bacillus sp. UFRGS-B20]